MIPKDPNFDREAKRYERPIASRKFILSQISEAAEPLTARQIAGRLGITDPEDKRALKARLAAMQRSGELVMNKRRGYRLPVDSDLKEGTISAHPDGFGFLMIEGLSSDVYLGAPEMKRYLHGDRVLARMLGEDARGRPEAEIVKVVSRSIKEITGRLVIQKHRAFVEPLNRQVHQAVNISQPIGAEFKSGQIVVVAITDYGSIRAGLTGQIKKLLADELTPEVEIEVVLNNHQIPVDFPESALIQAKACTSESLEAEINKRKDLRHLPFVTIDGDDAKDFDDAVYAEATGEGYALYVAIADVGHYVKRDSPLYEEAINRGTSVYFPQRVVPMLPEGLSNGLCSLRPDEDRLVLVCELMFDAHGNRGAYRFYEGVIRSKARLIYEEAADWLAGTKTVPKIRDAVAASLTALNDLYQRLWQQREARGALEIETPELKIGWDTEGALIHLAPVARTEAHKLIEECMLAANVAMAEFITSADAPGLFRVHDEPDTERVERLASALAQFGLALDAELGRVKTQNFQKILDATRDMPASSALQMLVLRTMNRAIYTPEARPHFGLNYPSYAHFTSPIRRLSDLVNHHLVKESIAKRKRGRRPTEKPVSFEDMLQLGDRASVTERRADMAVYEVLAWLKCEYLKQFVGDAFEGVITTVTKFGLFVTLEPMMAEGLVHISNLPKNRYQFDPEQSALFAEKTGAAFRMGDRVLAQLDSVDSSLGQVSLSLVTHEPVKRRGQSAGRKNAPKRKGKSTTRAKQGRRGK